MSIRILLVEDHHIMREGLWSLLEKEQGLDVVGEAENGRAAVKLAAELHPGIVIMDVGMPELNGVEATRQILAETPAVKVIALSMHSERQFVSGMLEAGASGYLLKDSVFDELAEAIRVVKDGGTYLAKGIAAIVVEDYVGGLRSRKSSTGSQLTPREREVLQLIAEGHTTKSVAAQLHISVKTVETHRLNIMEKLRVNSVAKLTKYAIREGITSVKE